MNVTAVKIKCDFKISKLQKYIIYTSLYVFLSISKVKHDRIFFYNFSLMENEFHRCNILSYFSFWRFFLFFRQSDYQGTRLLRSKSNFVCISSTPINTGSIGQKLSKVQQLLKFGKASLWHYKSRYDEIPENKVF